MAAAVGAAAGTGASPPTADLMDVFQGLPGVQVAPNSFRDLGGIKCFSGKICTVKCFENNPLVRERLTGTNRESGTGKVLVVDGGGSTRVALMGDMLATGGADNGWAGVIINGAIRDSAVVRGVPIGCKALGTNPAKSSKKVPGESDVTVSFAGLTFTPGHWVYADEDGIIVADRDLRDDQAWEAEAKL